MPLGPVAHNGHQQHYYSHQSSHFHCKISKISKISSKCCQWILSGIFLLLLCGLDCSSTSSSPNSFYFKGPSAKRYSSRIVQTEYGQLKGVILERRSIWPRDVEAFFGIPYASPPVGTLRFMPPLTPSVYPGVRICDTYPPVCPQILPNKLNASSGSSNGANRNGLLKYKRLLKLSSALAHQNEDCLYLNIYLPVQDEHEKRNKNLAIVVILVGDSWEWGSGGLVEGSAFASFGQLMVITMNQRLGILGFLQTGNQIGNYAIMDIVAALSWIRENGQAFGGDINRVTLLGHKTGAALANFLLISPLAKELFHRVILLSGSALSPWSLQRGTAGNVQKLAELVGCQIPGQTSPEKGKPGTKSQPQLPDLGPCFRSKNLETLLTTANQHFTSPRFYTRLGPIVDNSVIKSDYLRTMRDSEDFSKIPLLLGSTTLEEIDEIEDFSSNSETTTTDTGGDFTLSKFDRILRTLVRNTYDFHQNEIFSIIKNEYQDWDKLIGNSPQDLRDSIGQILGDALSLAPMMRVANYHSANYTSSPTSTTSSGVVQQFKNPTTSTKIGGKLKKKSSNTYFLHFELEPPAITSSSKSGQTFSQGSRPRDLLDFATAGVLQGDPDSDSEENGDTKFYSAQHKKLCKNFIHYIINFIVSGNPNSDEGLSGGDLVELPHWDSYDPTNQLYLSIGPNGPKMKNHFRAHKMSLWLNLIPQINQLGGPRVSLLHHRFRQNRPEYYEGSVRGAKERLQPAFRIWELDNSSSISGSSGHSSSSSSSSSSSINAINSNSNSNQPTTSWSEENSLSEFGDYDNDLTSISINTIEKSIETKPQVPGSNPNTVVVECLPENNVNNPEIIGHPPIHPPIQDPVQDLENLKNITKELGENKFFKELTTMYQSHGAALAFTIGIGSALLFLNLLILLKIYGRQRSNNGRNTRVVQQNSSNLPNSGGKNPKEPGGKSKGLCEGKKNSRNLRNLYFSDHQNDHGNEDFTDIDESLEDIRVISNPKSKPRTHSMACGPSPPADQCQNLQIFKSTMTNTDILWRSHQDKVQFSPSDYDDFYPRHYTIPCNLQRSRSFVGHIPPTKEKNNKRNFRHTDSLPSRFPPRSSDFHEEISV